MDGRELGAAPELLEAVFAAADAWYGAGTESEDAGDVLWVRDARCPGVYDANHARRLRAPVDPSAFLAAMDARYAACGHRAVRLDPRSRADALEAELLLRGWSCELLLVMAIPGAPRVGDSDARIVEAASDADWRAFARLKQAEFEADGIGLPAATWADHLRRKHPPARTWLASVDGEPVGFFSSLVEGAAAVLEDLYVLPRARGRGVGSALVGHSAAQARRHGARVCFLLARADDTPKDMYAGMGFRAIATARHLLGRPG